MKQFSCSIPWLKSLQRPRPHSDDRHHPPDFLRCSSQLEKKQALPPFQPQITDEYGLDNFDTQFTSEPVQLTPDDE